VYEPASVRWSEQGQTVAAEAVGRWLASAYGDSIATR
jgi:hypothetical protein